MYSSLKRDNFNNGSILEDYLQHLVASVTMAISSCVLDSVHWKRFQDFLEIRKPVLNIEELFIWYNIYSEDSIWFKRYKR